MSAYLIPNGFPKEGFSKNQVRIEVLNQREGHFYALSKVI